MADATEPPIAIIGAGPVGCLLCCYLSQLGYRNIALYDVGPLSEPARTGPQGRSINIAWSYRGRLAARRLGIEDRILALASPMTSRLIHPPGSEKQGYELPYGRQNEAIYSVSRGALAQCLLQETLKNEGVRVYGRHKLMRADFNSKPIKLTFNLLPSASSPNGTGSLQCTEVDCSFVFGCDGAYSVVREMMSRTANSTTICVEHIEHAYKEFSIPPAVGPEDMAFFERHRQCDFCAAREKSSTLNDSRVLHNTSSSSENSISPSSSSGHYRMCSRHLHIWPRGDFMMIALPNADKSFTAILFAPLAIFKRLGMHRRVHLCRAGSTAFDSGSESCPQDMTEIETFFSSNFPDFVAVAGRDRVLHEATTNVMGLLPMCHVQPFAIDQGACLLGDSAHTVLPFYGQGMNCGFEDCVVYADILKRVMAGQGPRLECLNRAALEYSSKRKKDVDAISQLSLENYVEMRDKVRSFRFRLRKWLDSRLHCLLGSLWIPQYTMVAFTGIPYSEVIRQRDRQALILDLIGSTAFISSAVATAFLIMRLHRSFMKPH